MRRTCWEATGNMSEADFLVKFRDCAQMLADAIQERLEFLAFTHTEATEVSSWDPSKIKWQPAQGTSGPYEKSSDVDCPDFKELLARATPHPPQTSQKHPPHLPHPKTNHHNKTTPHQTNIRVSPYACNEGIENKGGCRDC